MDWKKLLGDLERVGWTQTRIAERCGVSQAAVSELSRGISKQPRFAFGQSLVALHAELIGTAAVPGAPAQTAVEG